MSSSAHEGRGLKSDVQSEMIRSIVEHPVPPAEQLVGHFERKRLQCEQTLEDGINMSDLDEADPAAFDDARDKFRQTEIDYALINDLWDKLGGLNIDEVNRKIAAVDARDANPTEMTSLEVELKAAQDAFHDNFVRVHEIGQYEAAFDPKAIAAGDIVTSGKHTSDGYYVSGAAYTVQSARLNKRTGKMEYHVTDIKQKDGGQTRAYLFTEDEIATASFDEPDQTDLRGAAAETTPHSDSQPDVSYDDNNKETEGQDQSVTQPADIQSMEADLAKLRMRYGNLMDKNGDAARSLHTKIQKVSETLDAAKQDIEASATQSDEIDNQPQSEEPSIPESDENAPTDGTIQDGKDMTPEQKTRLGELSSKGDSTSEQQVDSEAVNDGKAAGAQDLTADRIAALKMVAGADSESGQALTSDRLAGLEDLAGKKQPQAQELSDDREAILKKTKRIGELNRKENLTDAETSELQALTLDLKEYRSKQRSDDVEKAKKSDSAENNADDEQTIAKAYQAAVYEAMREEHKVIKQSINDKLLQTPEGAETFAAYQTALREYSKAHNEKIKDSRFGRDKRAWDFARIDKNFIDAGTKYAMLLAEAYETQGIYKDIKDERTRQQVRSDDIAQLITEQKQGLETDIEQNEKKRKGRLAIGTFLNGGKGDKKKWMYAAGAGAGAGLVVAAVKLSGIAGWPVTIAGGVAASYGAKLGVNRLAKSAEMQHLRQTEGIGGIGNEQIAKIIQETVENGGSEADAARHVFEAQSKAIQADADAKIERAREKAGQTTKRFMTAFAVGGAVAGIAALSADHLFGGHDVATAQSGSDTGHGASTDSTSGRGTDQYHPPKGTGTGKPTIDGGSIDIPPPQPNLTIDVHSGDGGIDVVNQLLENNGMDVNSLTEGQKVSLWDGMTKGNFDIFADNGNTPDLYSMTDGHAGIDSPGRYTLNGRAAQALLAKAAEMVTK